MSIVLQGSTSGSITLQEPAIAGSTVLDLPAVSGTILTTTSPKAGNVIQVVQATYSTSTSTTSSTYSDTGLTASITPTSSTSKILVIVHHAGCGKNTGNTQLGVRLLRGASVISTFEDPAGYDNVSGPNYIGSVSTCFLDSPATTSSTTYKTQYASLVNINGVQLQGNNVTSTITLMEIAA